jgi:LmbE family N-acetylglucosaminyl deacetylase
MFQEYYRLREQARDNVKAMIQRDNPEVYPHVDHSTTPTATAAAATAAAAAAAAAATAAQSP